MCELSKTQRYHIVLSRPFDFAEFDAKAEADACPRHTMSSLQKALNARVVQPNGARKSIVDFFRSKIPGVGDAEKWALARQMAEDVDENDVVFSIGEDAGFPIATMFSKPEARPRLCVFVHNPDRPRVKYMFWSSRLRERVDLFITNTEYKADLLHRKFGVPRDHIYCIEEQTDTEFFRPGPASQNKTRSIVGSGGLEQRDYATLAKATETMNVDVRVSAASPNAHALSDTFPKPLPENMTIKHYDWRELRQLYRDSDVFVISLKNHNYQAGLTTLFEALACCRPVVMTKTAGLVEQFARSGFLTAVPPSDPAALRAAILHLLEHPELAREQARRGYDAVLQKHTSERYVSNLVEQISRL